MDIKRIILYVLFAVVAVVLWHTWEQEYPTRVAKLNALQTQAETSVLTSSSPLSDQNAPPSSQSHPVTQRSNNQQLIHISTALYNFVIDPKGGRIVRVDLKKYPQHLHSTQPVTLINRDSLNHYTAGSYLTGLSQQALDYTTASHSYSLNPHSTKPLTVVLQATTDNGMQVSKLFTFHPNSYLVDVNYHLNNHSNQTQNAHLTVDITRTAVPPPHPKTFHMSSYYGFAVSTPHDHYEKYKFKSLKTQPINLQAENGWFAMTEHYFLTAWIPQSAQIWHYTSQYTNNLYTVEATSQAIPVAPHAATTFAAQLYCGPKITNTLKATAPYLNMTIDYGFLWPISRILFNVMTFIHHLVHNWGLAIIITTALIKLAFWHLSAKSYRSMAAMRALQPKMEALKATCGDDKARFSKEMMMLYKQEKINPMGGCLPILVQIPFYISLYFVLIASIELRQAPFIFWIHDLSTKDPYYILPVLMGISMFLQQRLSPPASDPTQAKLMMFMPIVVTLIFINFPSGLILYMLVNNIISVSQQWWITKHYKKKPKSDKSKSPAWKKEKLANRKKNKK